MDLSYATFQNSATQNSGTGLDLSYDSFKTAQSAPPQSSLFDKVKTAIGSYAQASADTMTTFGNAILHPRDTYNKIIPTFANPLMQGEAKAGEALYNIASAPPHQGLSTLVANTANLISGTASAVLSPITGLFNIAENVPGLKQVADTINIPFSATGFAGSWTTGKAVNWIPDSILPPASKDIIKQPLQELSSLVAQTALGGKIMEKISGEVKAGKTVTPEIATKIVEDAKIETQSHPAMTVPPPTDLSYDSFQKEVSAEPITQTVSQESKVSPELQPLAQEAQKYPTIHEGGIIKMVDGNPVKIVDGVDTFVHKSPNGWSVSESSTGRLLSESVSKDGAISKAKFNIDNVGTDKFIKLLEENKLNQEIPTEIKPIETKTGRTTQTLKPIEGTGTTKARGLSQGVEAKAIESKLTANFGDLPEYQTVSMADQAQKASEIIAKDSEMAKSIALGEKAPPKGVLPESVFVAVENKAIAEGDVQTLKDLANSKLSAGATTMGQRIRTLAERDPTSPVGIIQDVQKARADALASKDVTRQTSDTIKEIQKSMKKVATTKETWNSFVDSITC